MNFPRFNALCEAARGRGLHTELHVGELKDDHRDLVLVKVGRTGTAGLARSTSWVTLDRDAEVLHEGLIGGW